MNYISTSMLFVISECLVCLVSDVSRFVDERLMLPHTCTLPVASNNEN